MKTIDDNRVLSDDFRRQTSTLLGDLEGAEVVSGEELGIVQNIIKHLETARSLFQTVGDLITAEKMVSGKGMPAQ